jgi:hypothetical protein
MKNIQLIWMAALVFVLCCFPKPAHAVMQQMCQETIITSTVPGASGAPPITTTTRDTYCWWQDDGRGDGYDSRPPAEPRGGSPSGGGGHTVDKSPYPPQQCSMLAAGGLPNGCTKALANQFENLSNNGYVLFGAMPFMPDFGAMLMSGFMRMTNSALSTKWMQCYANPSSNPDACELAYRQGFIDAYNGSWKTNTDMYYFNLGMI